MAQSSAPLVGVNLSDADWRDLFGDEAGVIGDLDGTSYAVALPADSNIASVGSATQASVARVAGFSHRINAGSTEPLTIAAAVGSARTDIIALKYDPAHTGAPGPVRLALIAGTSAALPTYDDSPPGVEYLPLWGVTRQPGQALSQATLQRLFTRLAPSLDVPTAAPLPLSSPLGTIVTQGSKRYRRELGGGGVPVWVAWPPDSGYLNMTVQSPFTAVTSGGSPGAQYRVVGEDVDFAMRLSRSTGWTSGTALKVASFPAGARPGIRHYFRATKDATDGIGSGQVTVDTNGDVLINFNGQAGNSLYVSGSFTRA